ncbi:glycosyltransferase family 2 protein [Reichenbachiella ulvae]|uniref:Glycosyltransferase family 2 protein n=1 Tax=Reichenbachiella ulvae TaxID=2980104 RepID=A0ABT3CQ00_9BACT|nr:glycosyltransferase family 2 protein [Reichenbachiella ulvae]MCV9385795.1 glycosyltransferase family 2 protein [Reichenbachiella ulvae]
MAKTAIVILNFNGVDFLKKFLAGVVANSPEGEVIVADNGSTDDSVSYLKQHFPHLRLILFESNHGFTGGYNRAIAEIDHEYCVLLNSDIEVTPGWLNPITEFLDQNPHVAACQPKIKSYDQKDHFEYAGAAGGFLDALGYPYCRGRMFDTLEVDNQQYDNPVQCFWATGASMFIRTDIYKKLGGLDEEFFAHMEEIDLCWRIQKHGLEVWCIPQSEVYHVGGGTLNKSNPRKTYLNFRNNLAMVYKNERAMKLAWLLPLRFTLDFISGIQFWVEDSFAHFQAVLKAQIDFVMSIPHLNQKRKQFKKQIKQTSVSRNSTSVVLQYFIRGKKHFSNFN